MTDRRAGTAAALDFWGTLRADLQSEVADATVRRMKISAIRANGNLVLQEVGSGTVYTEEYARIRGGYTVGDYVAVAELRGRGDGNVVSSTKLVLGVISNAPDAGGSITGIDVDKNDVSGATNVQTLDFGHGFIIGEAPAGQANIDLDWAGTGVQNQPARGDHNHDAAYATSGHTHAYIPSTEIRDAVYVLNAATSGTAPSSGSTTSTTVWENALQITLTLPTGTWRVFAQGGMILKHSVSTANIQIDIDGTADTLNTLNVLTEMMIGIDADRSGVAAGTRVVSLQFKSSAAGTTNARNPWMFVIAQRTS